MSMRSTKKHPIDTWEQTHFRQRPLLRSSGIQARWQSILKGWYHLAAPSEPPPTATIAQREAVRRGRLASFILLAALLFCAFSGIAGFLNQNFVSAGLFTFLCVMSCVLLAINKRGYLTLVGIIFVILAQFASIQVFFTPGGLTVRDLTRVDTLAVQTLLCIAFLPPFGILIIASVTCIYIWVILTYAQRAPDLVMLFTTHQANGIMERPMILNILIAVILYLWASSAERAIARADRAESIAALEHTIAEQEHELAEGKEQLERSIQLITETHRRIANGDENARVPLDSGNKLWPVAGMLNNLLARLQFLRRESTELERTRQEAERLAVALRKAKTGQRPEYFPNRGTALDTVTVELINQGLLHPPSDVNKDKKRT